MRFFLISDNVDTALGLRLAGIDSKIVQDRESVISLLSELLETQDIGIVLITRKLVDMCPDFIQEINEKYRRPLITEIPDRHGSDGGDSITRYVRSAIGIKV